MNLLTIQNLSLTISNRPLLTQLNIQIQAGQCWCIIGRNGTGKTTLLKKIAGLQLMPRINYSGEIYLGNILLENHTPQSLALLRAYAASKWQPNFVFSVIDWITASCWPKRLQWDSTVQQIQIWQALHDCCIDQLAQRDLRSLSDGEQQRVALAACIVQDTPLLLLDEPMAHLDLAHQLQFIQLLKNRCLQKKIASMVSLHDIHLAKQGFTHALIFLPNGTWVAGEASQILRAEILAQSLGMTHSVFSSVYGNYQ